MKCPQCFCVASRVKDTRTLESGIIQRRRRCVDCGTSYNTWELPPGAVSFVRYALTQRWEKRQTGPYKSMLRSRQILAARMRRWRSNGDTVKQIAERTGMSTHMVYYYTAPSKGKR